MKKIMLLFFILIVNGKVIAMKKHTNVGLKQGIIRGLLINAQLEEELQRVQERNRQLSQAIAAHDMQQLSYEVSQAIPFQSTLLQQAPVTYTGSILWDKVQVFHFYTVYGAPAQCNSTTPFISSYLFQSE